MSVLSNVNALSTVICLWGYFLYAAKWARLRGCVQFNVACCLVYLACLTGYSFYHYTCTSSELCDTCMTLPNNGLTRHDVCAEMDLLLSSLPYVAICSLKRHCRGKNTQQAFSQPFLVYIIDTYNRQAIYLFTIT